MKKNLIVVAFVVIIALVYFALKIDKGNSGEVLDNQSAIYTSSEIGLSFVYPSGPDGYVVDERMPVDLGTGLVKNILLQRTEDTLKQPPENSEWPPMIVVSVFENQKKQFAGVWASENIQYSNINLKQGEIKEVVVGGANAIAYMADGLYASDNVVVAHGENIYVFNGQFIDENSDIRRDFESLLASVKFIPKPNQE
jgi:hypothetical protein